MTNHLKSSMPEEIAVFRLDNGFPTWHSFPDIFDDDKRVTKYIRADLVEKMKMKEGENVG